MALLSAVATLLGALFLCLDPPDEHHRPGITLDPARHSAPAFSCPNDRGACGLLPTVSAAVLTAPPPDSPADPGHRLPRLDRDPVTGAPTATPARPRAPDLHVLQVLRT
ncbi:hypothetical protein I3J09_21090 [Streptomyces clavuligerus]|nr:hypothetical protein [Streptomyces clavuligerus]QPL66709.1 hypothetical protein I3J04_21075 [Streptomyces clavuligerus]QPL72738.1 hypothetical protein I3J05_21085 [Streptomyces clavuligerus]QPL78815.1 hypothetical protein I3J06_21090 [Streptomyces clavuligerus]QPL84843.1 hypothetical protein I3J07_21125 [Streptomyces clavuligerus]